MFGFNKIKGHAKRVRTGVIRHWKVWEEGWARAQAVENQTRQAEYSHVWYIVSRASASLAIAQPHAASPTPPPSTATRPTTPPTPPHLLLQKDDVKFFAPFEFERVGRAIEHGEARALSSTDTGEAEAGADRAAVRATGRAAGRAAGHVTGRNRATAPKVFAYDACGYRERVKPKAYTYESLLLFERWVRKQGD